MLEILSITEIMLNNKKYQWKITSEALNDKEYKDNIIKTFYSVIKFSSATSEEIADAYLKNKAVNEIYKKYAAEIKNNSLNTKRIYIAFVVLSIIDIYRQEDILNKSVFYAFKYGNNLADDEAKKMCYELKEELKNDKEENVSSFELYITIVQLLIKCGILEMVMPDVLKENDKRT